MPTQERKDEIIKHQLALLEDIGRRLDVVKGLVARIAELEAEKNS